MTKGNPLWETSYHSIATIQKKKKKSSRNWATPPGKSQALNLTRGSFALPVESILQGVIVIITELPRGGYVHGQGAHLNVFDLKTIFCASSPREGICHPEGH